VKSGDGLQQELREIAEGDGVFAGDAALRHEEEGMGDGAVDVGGGGEIAAERFECGRLKSRATCTAASFCFQGVLAAKLCALIAAAPPVGKSVLAMGRGKC